MDVVDFTIRESSGSLLLQCRLLEELRKQYGYSVFFAERQKFLTVLKNKIQHQDKLRTNQRVIRIEEVDNKVKIYTEASDVFEAGWR